MTLAEELRLKCDCANCRMCARVQVLETKMAASADHIDAQAATIARLEAENAQMRSLISSRPDAPQAFWDEHRAAMEAARQRAFASLTSDRAKT